MSESNKRSYSPYYNPVVPQQYDGSHKLNFRCYKGISCFNACCKSIDITLTPYDIVRLKQRLDLSSSEFLVKYGAPYEMDKDGLPGIRLRTKGDTTECSFMTEEGCSVYEDRPTACRYYPVGLISMRKEDEYTDSASYALVKEDHCKGHEENDEWTIDSFRENQGIPEYDEHGRGWRQLVLKKKSSGPSIGAPSKRSLQLFFTACYDIDRFRMFIASDGFRNSFEVEDELYLKLLQDDVELLEFGYRFLKQVMFGEETIGFKQDAVEAMQKKREAEYAEQHRTPDYNPAAEPVDIA